MLGYHLLIRRFNLKSRHCHFVCAFVSKKPYPPPQVLDLQGFYWLILRRGTVQIMGRKGGETVADEGQKNVSLLDLQRVLYLLHGLRRQAALSRHLSDGAPGLQPFRGLRVFGQQLLVRHSGS